MTAAASNPRKYTPIMGGFVPFAALWEDASGGPLFTSESSARWFIRTNRPALIKAKAIAMHAGWMLVHPRRFEAVAQLVALDLAARRSRVPERGSVSGKGG